MLSFKTLFINTTKIYGIFDVKNEYFCVLFNYLLSLLYLKTILLEKNLISYIMKITFYIFILFFSMVSIKGQMKVFDSTYINRIDNLARSFENEKKYESALIQYAYLKKIDSAGKAGKNAEIKIAQLLLICQNQIYNLLKGKWILKKSIENENSVLKSTQTIEVKEDLITFHDTQNVIFEYNLQHQPFFINLFGEYPSLKIENEIWVLNFRTINNEERLIWMKKIDKNGNFQGMIDDRGIIMDPKKRKEALEKEIYTYFVKLK